MSEVTLDESEWRRIQCPFETVQKFKTGYSNKCPNASQVVWVKQEGKDEAIVADMKIKRDCGCVGCMHNMEKFLEVRP